MRRNTSVSGQPVDSDERVIDRMGVGKRTVMLVLLAACLWERSAFGSESSVALQQLQEDFNKAVATVRPAVVSIKAEKKDQAMGVKDPAPLWYESIGSGFIVDERGFVVTNYHVVRQATSITVSLWRSQRTEYTAEVVDADESLDLALLKIGNNESFVPAILGNAGRLEVGDWVLCMGSPFGFEHTVTCGIVSALNRSLVIEGRAYNGMIQTDAVINLGNSGGPLIDIYGRVVGVGTAIYAPEGTCIGLGFAIPINRVRAFFTRVTGAQTVALTVPMAQSVVPKEKESVNLNEPMPKDAAHKSFTDCTRCHTVSQKIVVSLKAPMPHPAIGPCEKCHFLINDPVARGPVPVAAVRPATGRIF